MNMEMFIFTIINGIITLSISLLLFYLKRHYNNITEIKKELNKLWDTLKDLNSTIIETKIKDELEDKRLEDILKRIERLEQGFFK